MPKNHDELSAVKEKLEDLISRYSEKAPASLIEELRVLVASVDNALDQSEGQ